MASSQRALGCGGRGSWALVGRAGPPTPSTLTAPVALQTEMLLLQAERRALCACWPAGR